jgi:threonine-phosphate decarboxylase
VAVTAAPPPGRHGGDGAALARRLGIPPEAVLDLSASLNPAAPDLAPLVVAAAPLALRRYPDATVATAALGAAMEVDADRLVLTNGGAEAIALVAQHRPRGWVDEPDFSLYAHHLRAISPGAPRWRSNPHNPTGQLAPADDRAAVWDEAFYPLATGRWTRGDGGATVVGSLTKLFACPGLRIGYALAADPDEAAALRRLQPAWSVNGLACAVLPDLLAGADLAGWAAQIARLRAALVAALARRGFAALPSDANYVLVPDAPGLRDGLAGQAILVRDTASFGLRGGVRIAVPDAAGVDRLDRALAALAG